MELLRRIGCKYAATDSGCSEGVYPASKLEDNYTQVHVRNHDETRVIPMVSCVCVSVCIGIIMSMTTGMLTFSVQQLLVCPGRALFGSEVGKHSFTTDHIKGPRYYVLHRAP